MNTLLKHLLLLTAFLTGAVNAFSQEEVLVKFADDNKKMVAGELLTNVAKIYNNQDFEQTIKITFDYPFGWKQIGAAASEYTISAKDTLFIPVRFVPTALMGGNNKYMVNINVLTLNDRYLAGATFWGVTQKQTSWVLTSNQGNVVYFKNGENQTNFSLNVLNTGAENQPITMTLNNMSLFSVVVDSLGNQKVQKPIQLQLEHMRDTTLNFVFKHEGAKRNTNRIDIENYKPYSLNESRTFTLMVNTEEPNLGQEGAFSKNQRVVFKKLAERTRSNPNAFSKMPIVVDYNVSNLMDNVSFSTLNIRGNAQVSNDAQFLFNIQSSTNSESYNDVWLNTNYYAGYFHTKGNIQLGFVNGGFMGMQSFGKGIKLGYNANNRNSFSTFLVNNQDRNGKNISTSLGLGYQFRYFKQNKVAVEYGESTNHLTGVKTNVLNTRAGINLFKGQTLSGSYSVTFNQINKLQQTKGAFYLINYSGTFIKNKIAINHTIGNNDANYALSGTQRMFYNHRTRVNITENWSATMVNNINKTKSLAGLMANYNSYNNQFSVIRSFKLTSVQAAFNYNQFEFVSGTNMVKSVSFTHNTFKPKEFVRFSATLEGGVNSPKVANVSQPEQVFFMFNSLLFYKTLTVNTRYLAGSFGSTPVINNNQTKGQQTFTTSLQHQYVFAKSSFMLQTGLNYYYNNIFKQHTLNLFPDIYYFTQNNWRFNAALNYNFMSGVSLRNVYNPQASTDENPRITNQGLFVTFGVRKEINVPVPFKKQQFVNTEFVAFFDVNGNGIKDKNERPLENVVVKVNDDEVLTNAEGAAYIDDAQAGLSRLIVIPLDEVEGWFANVNDSIMLLKNKVINIPFVKGVKIKGKVSIKRENIGADANEAFDLSRIKITAAGAKSFNTLTGYDGTFEFYLPFGNYVISFDENVLGDSFKITKNNYNILASKDTDGLVISFHVIEKTRKINRKVFGQPAK